MIERSTGLSEIVERLHLVDSKACARMEAGVLEIASPSSMTAGSAGFPSSK